jgi:hypothetical protein
MKSSSPAAQTLVQPASSMPKARVPKAPKIKKRYFDIDNIELAQSLACYMRFVPPSGGIHKPMVWIAKHGWGVVYKVIAKVSPSNLKKLNNSSKFDVVEVKWKARRSELVPETGYEDAAKSVDIKESNDFRSFLLKKTNVVPNV